MLNLKSVGAEPTRPSIDPAEGLLNPAETFESVSAKIGGIVLERKHPPFWWISFGIAFLLLMGLLYGIMILLAYGVFIWGINIPVAWGFAIVNFVWWIGIGHAGTLISAILLLLLQKWRNSINRLAPLAELSNDLSYSGRPFNATGFIRS
jgi:hypothetical protein